MGWFGSKAAKPTVLANEPSGKSGKNVAKFLMSPMERKCFDAWLRYTVKERFEKEQKDKINQMIADAAKKQAERLANGEVPEKKEAEPAKRGVALAGGEAAKIQALLREKEEKRKAADKARFEQRAEQRATMRKTAGSSEDEDLPPPLWPSLDQLVEAGIVNRKKFNIADLFANLRRRSSLLGGLGGAGPVVSPAAQAAAAAAAPLPAAAPAPDPKPAKRYKPSARKPAAKVSAAEAAQIQARIRERAEARRAAEEAEMQDEEDQRNEQRRAELEAAPGEVEAVRRRNIKDGFQIDALIRWKGEDGSVSSEQWVLVNKKTLPNAVLRAAAWTMYREEYPAESWAAYPPGPSGR